MNHSTTSVNLLAEKKYKRGMTFGGFDLCHVGHVNLLRRAKERCEELIVCVSTDEYIKNIKGITPVLSLPIRTNLVEMTGYATAIDKQTVAGKKEMVDKYKPDVLFVGDDWNENTYNGEGLCHVEYLPRTEGVSTTMLRSLICV